MNRGHHFNKQQGISLVAVIFLITVLALAVVFLQRISSVSVATNNLNIQGARAWQAAEAGAEWGIYQVLNGGCPAATNNFNLSEGALTGFRVQVTCNSTTFNEQGGTVTLYFLNIFAQYGTFGTSPDYTSRRLSLTVES